MPSRRPLSDRIGSSCVLLLCGLAACAAPFDMGAERTALRGPEWGVVIGSMIVQPESDGADGLSWGGDAARRRFRFEVVKIQSDDPYGTRLFAPTFEFTTKAGEERMFVSRLRPGEYLVRSFRDTKIAGLGGDLDVIFTVEPGEVRYVGRLQLRVPHILSRGHAYRFSIDNVREQTLAQAAAQHADLTTRVVNAPMQARTTMTPVSP